MIELNMHPIIEAIRKHLEDRHFKINKPWAASEVYISVHLNPPINEVHFDSTGFPNPFPQYMDLYLEYHKNREVVTILNGKWEPTRFELSDYDLLDKIYQLCCSKQSAITSNQKDGQT